jgi:aspartyl aminopeptidase
MHKEITVEDNEEKKTDGQVLGEKLLFDIKNCWETAKPEEITALNQFAESYKNFLDRGKTERECIGVCLSALKERGFTDIEELLEQNGKLQPGAKVYQNIRGKSLIFAVIGKEPVTNGINIVGAHVDSPRIDLKPNPLYEDTELALFDTHYYGGIKFYQWTAIPLAMHGVIIGKDGSKKIIRIGEDDGDPVFTITDLLPHLAREQMQKKASEFVGGEELDILAGSEPYKDAKAKDKVKLKLLSLLNEKYRIVEEDFAGAEIEFVPAFRARDIGLDRSMIGAYGHDDRCCAFASFSAVLQFADTVNGEAEGQGELPRKTVVCFLSDKEEIGSIGNTGAQSREFENFIAYLCVKNLDQPSQYSEFALRKALSRSCMLSADVNAAFDPNFSSVFDKKTASYFGRGLALTKYTGHSGKYGGSEANAEFCQKVQAILNRNNIRWQFGCLGKVNAGGGGTIAQFAAKLGIEVLDCGIPVLSMHSPFEVISKIDLYIAYRGFTAFLTEA